MAEWIRCGQFEVRQTRGSRSLSRPEAPFFTVKLSWANSVVAMGEDKAEVLESLRSFINEAEAAYAALERMESSDG